MGIQVVSGQKVILTKSLDGVNRFTFKMQAENKFRGLFDMDLFAVNVEKNGMINRENIVYYNNVKDIKESILYSETYNYELFEKNIDLDIKLLPDNTDKVVVISTLYNNLSEYDNDKEIEFSFKAVDKTTGLVIFNLSDKILICEKETLVLGEVYKYKDTWRFNTINNYSDVSLLGLLDTIYNAKIY